MKFTDRWFGRLLRVPARRCHRPRRPARGLFHGDAPPSPSRSPGGRYNRTDTIHHGGSGGGGEGEQEGVRRGAGGAQGGAVDAVVGSRPSLRRRRSHHHHGRRHARARSAADDPLGAKFHASMVSPEQVSSFRTMEREKAEKMLDDYVDQCSKLKVKCETLVIEKEDVASGLLELIGLHGITDLVVAAAADRQYSRKLDRPMCRTAAAIMQRADASCKIWFVCKEQLVCTRDTEAETPSAPTAPPLLPNPDHEVLRVSTSQEEDDDDEDIEIELGFYDELGEARRAAEDLMNRALQESRRRQKADEELASSLHKAEVHKELYLQEVKKREELEAALVRAEREISELRQAIQRITAEEEPQEQDATATATRSMVLGQPGIVSVEPEAVLCQCQCQCQRKLAASSPSSVIPSCPHLDEDGFTCKAGAAGCCCWLDGMSSPVGAAQPLARPGYALRAVVQDYMRQQQQRCPFP